jgi:cobalt-precorrin 5A hydrolase
MTKKQSMTVHIFPVTDRGYRLARKIKAGLVDSRLYRPAELKEGKLKKRVKEAFRNSSALVFVCAAAVVVRTVAPYLKDKTTDPPVVSVDELGRFSISLVSGHLGGANELAREVAGLVGATPVVTTATDIRGLPCIEEIAKRFSLEIDNTEGIKPVNSAILRGRKVVVVDRDPERLRAIKGAFGHTGVFRFQRTVPKRLAKDRALVVISAQLDENIPRTLSKATLFLRPKEFVVGLGCKRGVTVKEFERVYGRVLSGKKLSPLSVRNFATIEIKRKERGLKGFAKRARVPVDFFSTKELSAIKPPSGPSRVVREKFGIDGVAEPAALASAGVRKIWLKKQKKGNITIAVAKVPFKS